jgi:hypothetical protein
MNENNMSNNEFHCLPKHRKLATEIAYELNDIKALPLYLSFAQKYPETFLKEILNMVLEIPKDKIRKTRGALFNYLVHKHGKENINNIRN